MGNFMAKWLAGVLVALALAVTVVFAVLRSS